jgi:hypothetical protein
MHFAKAFYVIIVLTNHHGLTERHVRTFGWGTEHQCHLKARWIEEQGRHTRAWCEQTERRH